MVGPRPCSIPRSGSPSASVVVLLDRPLARPERYVRKLVSKEDVGKKLGFIVEAEGGHSSASSST